MIVRSDHIRQFIFIDRKFVSLAVEDELALIETPVAFEHEVPDAGTRVGEFVVLDEILDDVVRAHGVKRTAHPRPDEIDEVALVAVSTGVAAEVGHPRRFSVVGAHTSDGSAGARHDPCKQGGSGRLHGSGRTN